LKKKDPQVPHSGAFFVLLIVCLFLMAAFWGCAERPKRMQLILKDRTMSFAPGSIIATNTGRQIPFETMMADLSTVTVIYIGESHTNAEHHEIQLKILTSLHNRFPGLAVGMEMFDRTYQPQLDVWSDGKMDENQFLKKVHWYANWRYHYALYRPILQFVKANHLPLIGLNLPFHIPPKISIGGIASLSDEEKRHLPGAIDFTDVEHRGYLQKIYSHHRIPGRDDFEAFYEAQCAWEDTMAETIARHSPTGKMAVLVGNGHIFRKFGIPNRAFNRFPADYRTVYPAEAGGDIEPTAADYIWVTAPANTLRIPHQKRIEADTE
jgi:uncharacterized iron-regulated protein